MNLTCNLSPSPLSSLTQSVALEAKSARFHSLRIGWGVDVRRRLGRAATAGIIVRARGSARNCDVRRELHATSSRPLTRRSCPPPKSSCWYTSPNHHASIPPPFFHFHHIHRLAADPSSCTCFSDCFKRYHHEFLLSLSLSLSLSQVACMDGKACGGNHCDVT